MERYRCDPQVLKACKIRKLYGCDGYYLGAGCRCAKDNQSIMAETEYQELQAYRATGLTVERAAELGKADREGRVIVLNEKTALALAAGSRAIRVSNLNHGTTYCYCTEESVKKIRYAEAEKIIFDLAEKVL